jgi:hypothetical protein|tara:strand:+ start:1672 stop:1896 length:225 start_codon:yes stop_codon:yes gene_type:complete
MNKILDKCQYCTEYVTQNQNFGFGVAQLLVSEGLQSFPKFKSIPTVWHIKCEDDDNLIHTQKIEKNKQEEIENV